MNERFLSCLNVTEKVVIVTNKLEIFSGFPKCYDQLPNIVLTDTTEYKKDSSVRKLEMILLRADEM